MRVRLHPEVAKKVLANKKTLTASAEVNRALDEYYEAKKTQPKKPWTTPSFPAYNSGSST